MPIWIDYRERALLALHPNLKQITPPVGDLWIGDLSGTNLLRGGVILERKTISDFEASFLDGRYHEQRGRLLAYANEHKVAIGYVIEGQIKGRSGRLSDAALEKFIIRLQFHHRIPVIKTGSVEETLRIAHLIDEQWAHDEGKLAWDLEKSSGQTPVSLSYVKSECRDTSETFLIGTLTQCRGVSEALAKLISKEFITLEQILKATSGELAAVCDPTNPKRKVGTAVAQRLYGLLHHTIIDKPLHTVKVKMPTTKLTKVKIEPQQICMIQEDEE
jgi:ERCC4-type nuclease